MKLTREEILDKYNIEKDFGGYQSIRLLDKNSGALVGFISSSELIDKVTDVPMEITEDSVLLERLNNIHPEYRANYIR